MTTKEAQEQLVENMRNWQKVENAAVASTGAVIEETDNPIIRLVMEIIQHDSQMHYRVQELIAESLTSKAVALSTDDLASVWSKIENHIAIEKKTVELAKQSLEATEKGRKGMLVQRYLLEYLLSDEQKHDKLLENLGAIKKDMYPYA
jgi:hypothetical protein